MSVHFLPPSATNCPFSPFRASSPPTMRKAPPSTDSWSEQNRRLSSAGQIGPVRGASCSSGTLHRPQGPNLYRPRLHILTVLVLLLFAFGSKDFLKKAHFWSWCISYVCDWSCFLFSKLTLSCCVDYSAPRTRLAARLQTKGNLLG